MVLWLLQGCRGEGVVTGWGCSVYVSKRVCVGGWKGFSAGWMKLGVLVFFSEGSQEFLGRFDL